MRGPLLPFAAMAVTLLASVGAFLALDISPARGAVSLPSGFTESQVVSGLSDPTDMEFAPDGRLFVTEKAGKVRIAHPNGKLATFLDISSKVDPAGELGLTGVALDPNFATNHFVYLHYTQKATTTTPAHNRVVRVTARGNRVVAGSEKLLFRLNDLPEPADHHVAGALKFGKDGKLYISTGDNGTPDNSQTLANLKGKILRINKDGTIPSNNPYYANTRVVGKNKAIWARGLRNPFKFAFKPGTRTMFINDVGGSDWEEINRGAARANYGWPIHEGPELQPDANYNDPIFAYRHGNTLTTGCSITGGAFYNPARVRFPSSYQGDYFFADFCNGWIRTYDPATDTARGFATALGSVVDLEVRKGTLYYLRITSPGVVGKIRYAAN